MVAVLIERKEDGQVEDGGRNLLGVGRVTEMGGGEDEERVTRGIGDCRFVLFLNQPFAFNSRKLSLGRATSDTGMEGGQRSVTSVG